MKNRITILILFLLSLSIKAQTYHFNHLISSSSIHGYYTAEKSKFSITVNDSLVVCETDSMPSAVVWGDNFSRTFKIISRKDQFMEVEDTDPFDQETTFYRIETTSDSLIIQGVLGVDKYIFFN